MKQQVISILLLTSVLVLLVSACNIWPPGGADLAGISVSDNSINSIESSNDLQAVYNSDEPLSNVDTEAHLDPGGSELLGSDDMIDVGSSPRRGSVLETVDTQDGILDQVNSVDTNEVKNAEKIQDPIYPTFTEGIEEVNPDDIPSPEERDAILDWVNRGGPVIPGSEEAVGEGPAPGTESKLVPGEVPNNVLDRVIPGGPELPSSDEATGEEKSSSTGTFLNRLIEILRNWWYDLLG